MGLVEGGTWDIRGGEGFGLCGGFERGVKILLGEGGGDMGVRCDSWVGDAMGYHVQGSEH